MLFVFTGLGLALFIAAVAALIWSIRSGQLDDLETPAFRLLNDDAAPQQRMPAATPAPSDSTVATNPPASPAP